MLVFIAVSFVVSPIVWALLENWHKRAQMPILLIFSRNLYKLSIAALIVVVLFFFLVKPEFLLRDGPTYMTFYLISGYVLTNMALMLAVLILSIVNYAKKTHNKSFKL